MEEIGLFPLGIVLLPGERVPLHVFEPRYRELIGECLELEREFGLVYADDDGLRNVGTRAAVVEVVERFEDGRLDVIVEGRERFQLQELTGGRSFQTAEVEPLVDDGAGPTPEQVERTLAVLRRVAELAETELDDELLAPSGDTPSFELAARVTLEPKLKQQLLEQRSEPARLEHLAELLEAAAKALKDRQAAAKLASGNGRLRRG